MLYFVPTPIGNLLDISFRSLEILKACEVLICEDTRVSKSLINLLNSKYSCSIKPQLFLSLHSHNEEEFLKQISEDLFQKEVVCVSDAGMPAISDPGNFLIKFALENNIAFEVLPGANAALVALVSSGFCEKEFIFLGFLSNKGTSRQKDIEKLLNYPFASIVYEAPSRVLSLVQDIAKIDAQREIFAIKEISKKFETKFKNKAKKLANELEKSNLNGEWVLVISAREDANFKQNTLCEQDILELDLPLKTKSKLLSKMSGKNAKEIYSKLLLSEN
ncbi:16S rRNA (cytidine(1402)-2'-O)-methyltransferase [Campylobacter sp. MIT 99-7217]|uniref:16S rRNA (cytidine(1402)-2'-O)-methyltransferase n=1 Tax=Campylobacter sp. MIT 99-7217 TaxID=535091 RepID=UPI001158FA1F|nr:16S rRNA (cytidine(1402)-2'-O)-methyltransferase [Campylobacter sp. MIT 99-7217]TQR30964.1 16S rRNA (cytidine(1402)-2'-O)-methyltransferase [Campylobacter sp. MIT 99-7217]